MYVPNAGGTAERSVAGANELQSKGTGSLGLGTWSRSITLRVLPSFMVGAKHPPRARIYERRPHWRVFNSFSEQATVVTTNMFRLLSRQAVKALPRPGLRLSTDTSRQIHSEQLPYTGPPSYETIARRFSSSQVDPQAYFTRKRQEEAKQRGEFIDIHDIGRDPNDYDVLITDVKHETLETTIAEELGIPYLSRATESQAKKVVQVGNGYIYGSKFRGIIPLVVSPR